MEAAMNFRLGVWLISAAIPILLGCNQAVSPSGGTAAGTEPATVLLSVTSDVNEHPQSVDMAMKLAGFSLDEGRRAVIFFNVQGVKIPLDDLSDSVGFSDAEPIKKQLQDLIGRGVAVHVCPICMQALGVEEADLMEGAQVTTRAALFQHIGGGTSVFTY